MATFKSLPGTLPSLLQLSGDSLSRTEYEDLKEVIGRLERIKQDHEKCLKSSLSTPRDVKENVARMLTHRDARKRTRGLTDRSCLPTERDNAPCGTPATNARFTLALTSMEDVSFFITGKTVEELMQTWDHFIHENDIVRLVREYKKELCFVTGMCFDTSYVDKIVSSLCNHLSRYLWSTYKINMARLDDASPYGDDEVGWVVNGIEFETNLPEDCWHEVISHLMREEGASVVRLRLVCRELNDAVTSIPKLLLKDFGLSDSAVASVCSVYSNLQELDISCNEFITDEGLRRVGNMEGLRRLNLASLNITGKGASCLAPLKRLERLNLRSTDIAASELHDILKGMDHLKELRLCDIECSFDDLKVLASHTKMEILDLTNCLVQDNVLVDVVSKMTRLRELYLTGNRITDDGIEAISHLSKMEQLHLGNTKITSACVKHLHGMPALSKLVFFGTKISRSCPEMAKLKAVTPALNKV